MPPLPNLLTAAGLEDFAELENTKKQALIKRLLQAEARHDRRVAETKKRKLRFRAEPVTDHPRLHDVPGLTEVETAGDSVGTRRESSVSHSRRSGRQSRRNAGESRYL